MKNGRKTSDVIYGRSQSLWKSNKENKYMPAKGCWQCRLLEYFVYGSVITKKYCSWHPTGPAEPGDRGAFAPHILEDELTLVQPGVRLCPPHYYLPPFFSDLPTALHISKWEMNPYFRKMFSVKVKFRYKYYTEITVSSRWVVTWLHLWYIVSLWIMQLNYLI